MTISVGVGGWTYEPWRDGTFYPVGLPEKSELEYASRALTAIEINATYYGRQKPQSWEKWAAAVPDGFVFSLKASQYTIRRKVLAEGGESIRKFLEQGFTALGDKLGPINWQFKDGKRFDREDFARFLDLIPDQKDGVALRHALEVRDESFRDTAFLDLAKGRNMAVVFADRADFPAIAEQTADFTYARLQQSREEETAGYPPAELDRWARQAREWASGGRDVFVFFISGAKHRNPAAALGLIERLA
ncbi:MAG: DUF72 domain-containing protein [Pelagerythrobacter marensis]|nr:MAG: DUF72 domain-containing protein [Pelagerythrobacter marensis]